MAPAFCDLSRPMLLVFHGSVSLMLGLLAGFGYGRAIGGGEAAADRQRAWRLLHGTSIQGALALILVALLEPALRIGTPVLRTLNGALLTSNWAFLVAMTVAAVSGHRGLDPGKSRTNNLVFALYTIASIATLLAAGLLVYGSAVTLAQ